MIDLTAYMPKHRRELEDLLASPEWQEALSSGLVDEARSERLEPGKTRDLIKVVLDPLLASNRQRVSTMIARGGTDRSQLLATLSQWPADLGDKPAIAFLGLNLTPACNLNPRCVYCNQEWVEPSMRVADWKRLIAEVTEEVATEGPYIYLTGGEPLTLGEGIWGRDGLVRFATERGAGVNINTNATLITPRVALALVRDGLLRLHISLDTADPTLHRQLRGATRLEAVLRGIYNIQLARELLGVSYPGIHTNCVLTNLNLERFPETFSAILEMRKRTYPGDPLFNDLLPHVIPVGGASNDSLRPTSSEFRRFFAEIWPRVSVQWQNYQAALGIEEKDRQALFGYFSNPFLRVLHRGGLEAYAQSAAEGRYGELALAERCYVAPTQAAFTPDGTQYRCGSHAIRHVRPLGDARDGVYRNIRESLAALTALPDPESCHGCALATLYINQEVERRLNRALDDLLTGAGRQDLVTSTSDGGEISDEPAVDL